MSTRDSQSSSEHAAVGSRGTGLRELSAKWRDRSTVHLRARHIDEHSAMAAADRGLGFAYGHCADELDAALSALPLEEGLRAWVQHKAECDSQNNGLRWEPHYKRSNALGRGWLGAWVHDSSATYECSCGLDAALARRREPQRCDGRYPVPQTAPPRDEPAGAITYRCALDAGHDGPHGALKPASPRAQETTP